MGRRPDASLFAVPELTPCGDIKLNSWMRLRITLPPLGCVYRPSGTSRFLKRQMSLSPDDKSHAGGPSIASDDAGSSITARKILKVLCDPWLAAALLNAQLCMRGKARLPWSVRLFGRICFRAGTPAQE
jgi:hypothetical protein